MGKAVKSTTRMICLLLLPTHEDWVVWEVKEDNETDEMEREDEGGALVATGRGEGGSGKAADDDTTTSDVGVMTDVNSRVDGDRDDRRLKSSVADDSVVTVEDKWMSQWPHLFPVWMDLMEMVSVVTMGTAIVKMVEEMVILVQPWPCRR